MFPLADGIYVGGGLVTILVIVLLVFLIVYFARRV
jgi:hypothetical protein